MRAVSNIIKQYDIKSHKDILKLENKIAFFLSDISEALIKQNDEIKSSPNGLSFNIKLNKHTTTSLTKRHLNNLSKKASIYSSKTIIEIPSIYFDINKGNGIDYYRLSNNKEYRTKKIKQFYNTFMEPYLKLENAIQKNLIEIYPKSYHVPKINPKFFDLTKPNSNKFLEKKVVKVKKYFKLKNSIGSNFIDLYTKKEELLNQLIEDKLNIYDKGELNLCLPFIDGIDIQTWNKIKNDNEDDFNQFYRKTELLFKNSSSIDSESKLLDVIKEVDYEVRKLNILFKDLERSRLLNNLKLVSGISIMSLNLVVPDAFAESILNVIGGSTALQGVWEVSTKKKNLKKMKKEDFFIPWLINTNS